MTSVTRIVGVYDADGGLRGELAYLAGKVRGQHCSLCDITHSPVRRRRAWDAYVSSLPVPFEVVHRNERDPRIASAATGREPCVVAVCDDGATVLLLGDDELRAAHDVDGLARAVDRALTRQGLAWSASSIS